MMHICDHGKCTNTFGSFMCTCNPGYRLDVSKAMCIGNDIIKLISVPGYLKTGYWL